jgi:hypothetical protein
MSFLHPRSTRAPLTEKRLMRILEANHCTARFRFGSVFAVDRTAQEYYVCRAADLPGMTVQHFHAALTRAFSFRVRES